MTFRVVVVLGGLAIAAACTAGGAATSHGAMGLTIFAAASLGNVLEEATAPYEDTHPGITLTIATDSSAALEAQIEHGAPADVFLSADATNPRKLVDGGFADGEAIDFAGTELTIITPRDKPGGVTGPFDLARPGIRIVAAADEVPITRYATQVVENLASLPGAPPDFAAGYAANIVSEEDNVSAVRAKIDLGEGDAAIVYATDAATSDLVAMMEVPDAANVRAAYAGVVIRSTANPEEARAFLDWLVSPTGQAILARFGFLPPPAA